MHYSLKSLTLAVVLAFPLAGFCAETDAVKPAPAPPAAAMQKAMEMKGAESPVDPAAEKAKAPETISGTVIQTMNSGGYSYVYLDNKDKKLWVAVPQMKVRVGDVMSFKSGSEMTNFPSTSLKRTFDRIIFSEGVISSSGGKGEETSPGASGAVVGGVSKDKIAKATGANAYTVAELFSKSAKLHKKKVVIHGKVVKVSANIMSKNWVHIQDGSGTSAKGTNNLVVTTADMPTVGDVVTAKGTLFKDKDFGGNYKYKVIVEDATISQ